MKSFLGLFVFCVMVQAQAQLGCEDKVFQEFKNATPKADYHWIRSAPVKHEPFAQGFKVGNRWVALNHPQEVMSLSLANEEWGGMGIYEMVYTEQDCQVLDFIQIYIE